jgi:Lysylphosphatidylglycerol synthase TM region
MLDAEGVGAVAVSLADAIGRAAVSLAEAIGGAAVGWLVLGVVLHLANQVARGRGWFGLVRMVRAGDPPLRRRDVIAAWVAGAGMGGVLSARGGDAVRLVLLRKRVPDAGYPLLAGTLVAETAGETAIGLALVVAIGAAGVGSGLTVDPASVVFPAAAVLVALAAGGVLWLRCRWARRVVTGVRDGCAPLAKPTAYGCAVLPWQLSSRLLRAASLACFLVAFGLPATPVAIAVVMLAQGGGRLLPWAPASVGAGVAVLAAGFPRATGVDPGVEALAGFLVGTSLLLTLVGILLAGAIALCLLGARPLLTLMRSARILPSPVRLRRPAGAG